MTKQERLERIEKIEAELAELKKAEVTPAKALTDAPEIGEGYWYSDDYGQVCYDGWGGHEYERNLLAQGRIFPYSLEGKLGATFFDLKDNA